MDNTPLLSFDPGSSSEQGGKPISVFSAVFILCNSCLGAATLAMPFTFHQAGGVVASTGILALCALLLAGTIFIYGYVEPYSRHHLDSLDAYALEFVGRWCSFLTQLILFLQALGTCSAYILVIHNQILLLLTHWVPESYADEDDSSAWYLNSYLLTKLVALSVIYPVSLKRNLDFLKYPSYLVFIAIIYVVVDVFVSYLVNSSSYNPELATRPDPWYCVVDAFPVFLMGFSCHLNAVPVYTNLSNKTLFNWAIVSSATALCCFVCYALIGIGGYLSFGSAVKSDVIQSMSADRSDVIVARIMMMLAIIFSYPVVMSVSREPVMEWYAGLSRYVGSCKVPSQEQLQQSLETAAETRCYLLGVRLNRSCIHHFIFTTVFVILTCLIGLLVKTLDDILMILGACSCHYFLILPGLFLIFSSHRVKRCSTTFPVNRSESFLWRLTKVLCGVFLTGLGVFVFGHGMTKAFNQILSQ